MIRLTSQSLDSPLSPAPHMDLPRAALKPRTSMESRFRPVGVPGTPSAMDAYTQPDRLKPPLRAQPDTASVLAAGRAEGADVSGADGSATLGMDAYLRT